MKKKLSIAFVWHMHQPMYKFNSTSDYLMPWVRMHAVKDYLDMLLIMDKYPKLKLNFNLVPLLLSMLIDYQNENTHDIHSRISIKDENDLSDEEKEFILNNFFAANYTNMIVKHEPYAKLYEKRYLNKEITINDFSLQEYSDIMMWFNLVWIDPFWFDKYPKLAVFLKKGVNFTKEDRIELINIQKDIISRIIPAYKKFQDEGRIEISTSPYYHPILPILLDIKDAQSPLNQYPLPDDNFDFKDDAKTQILTALDMCEHLFGKRPLGIWPSEHCISSKTLDMLDNCGINWVISDEGVLSSSIGREFVRDFKGNLELPYDLCKVYSYGKNKIKIIFRDAVIPNIIGFEYPKHNQIKAANDLYERIKIIQNKLGTSPDSSHLLTIAMDGENCWENFENDGADFLNTLYSLIEEDDSLETVTVSSYLEKCESFKNIKNIAAGSWINRNFSLWIAEPTKNLAWKYLVNTKKDFKEFVSKYEEQFPEKVALAQRELYIAEGSDWFWWYGEPNDSGQDYIFDYLFRMHLRNIYQIFDEQIPEYLNTSLTSFMGKPSRYPKKNISPIIDGEDTNDDNWISAGCIELPSGPVLSENKLFNKIYFGSDNKCLYFRFDMNSVAFQNIASKNKLHSVSILFKTDNSKYYSHIRYLIPSEHSYSIAKELFDYEIKFVFYKDEKIPIIFSKAHADGLWVNINYSGIKIIKKNIIEVSVPFDDLNIQKGEKAEVLIINSVMDVLEEIIPQDAFLTIYRNS